jgi:hypothetical protein
MSSSGFAAVIFRDPDVIRVNRRAVLLLGLDSEVSSANLKSADVPIGSPSMTYER